MASWDLHYLALLDLSIMAATACFKRARHMDLNIVVTSLVKATVQVAFSTVPGQESAASINTVAVAATGCNLVQTTTVMSIFATAATSISLNNSSN